MTYAVQQQPSAPVCQTCRQGYLVRRRVHRMSGPAVVIGYILLIPSMLGILTSIAFWVFSTFGAAGAASTSTAGDPAAAAAGAGCCFLLGSGTTICAAVIFLVSGLVGWLLIMKKDVLQCQNCSATVAAS